MTRKKLETNSNVMELYLALMRNKDRDMRYTKTSYAAFRTLSSIRSRGEIITSMRDNIIKSHGEDNGDGGFVVKPENVEAFRKEMDELMAEDASDITVYTVKRSLFDEDSEKLMESGITVGDMIIIQDYLVGEEE